MQNILSLVYQNGMIPTINKSTRVTRKTATTIDHILTNCFTETIFKTTIFKNDISNIFLLVSWLHRPQHKGKIKQLLFIKEYLTQSIESFKKKLSETDWEETESSKNPEEIYTTFLQKFIVSYDNYFPKRKIKLKAKDLESSWITRGIKNSSKRKQCLHEKFFKKWTEKNELEYKNYKKLFESVKKHSKKYIF